MDGANKVVRLTVPQANCTVEEFGQFPYRLLDWFLLLSRMGKSYTPAAPPQSCLSHARRTELAQVTPGLSQSDPVEGKGTCEIIQQQQSNCSLGIADLY